MAVILKNEPVFIQYDNFRSATVSPSQQDFGPFLPSDGVLSFHVQPFRFGINSPSEMPSFSRFKSSDFQEELVTSGIQLCNHLSSASENFFSYEISFYPKQLLLIPQDKSALKTLGLACGPWRYCSWIEEKRMVPYCLALI